MQTPKLFSHFKWEDETQGSLHQKTYIIGYEQRLSEKAGSIGCRVLSENAVTTAEVIQNRQFHLQYANKIKSVNSTLIYGFRAGFGNQIRRSSLGAPYQSGIGTHCSAGAALLFKQFYLGAGLINFYSSDILAKRTAYRYAAPVFTLQATGFLEINPDNPRVFMVPSFDFDLDGDDGVQVSLKLNAASPHLFGGAAVLLNENGLLPEVNFGYVAKRLRVGYSLAAPLDDFSSDNTIFQLHLGLFLSDSKEEIDDMAYYFKRLF